MVGEELMTVGIDGSGASIGERCRVVAEVLPEEGRGLVRRRMVWWRSEVGWVGPGVGGVVGVGLVGRSGGGEGMSCVD